MEQWWRWSTVGHGAVFSPQHQGRISHPSQLNSCEHFSRTPNVCHHWTHNFSSSPPHLHLPPRCCTEHWEGPEEEKKIENNQNCLKKKKKPLETNKQL